MAIESAKYYKDKMNDTNVAIISVDGGVEKSVGVNATDNIDYQRIQEWVKAGNSITAADQCRNTIKCSDIPFKPPNMRYLEFYYILI